MCSGGVTRVKLTEKLRCGVQVGFTASYLGSSWFESRGARRISAFWSLSLVPCTLTLRPCCAFSHPFRPFGTVCSIKGEKRTSLNKQKPGLSSGMLHGVVLCLVTNVWDSLSVPSSRVLNCVTLEDQSDRLFRNVGNQLQIKAA